MFKKLAAIAAFAAFSAPAWAFEALHASTSTMFYISIPLESGARRDREPSFGLMLQGNREVQAIYLDSRLLGFMPMGGVDGKWVAAGGVALLGILAAGRKDKGTAAQLQSQQQPPSGGCTKPKPDPNPC